MPTIHLTDRFIKNIQNPDKRREFYDDHLIENNKLKKTGVKGLALRVTPTGKKSFVYRYWRHGKAKRYTIGSYPSISLKKAREKAESLYESVNDGNDPLEERKAKQKKPDVITFKELSKIYDGIHLPTLRESLRDYHTWAMKTKVLPTIGKKNLKDVSQQDVIKLLDKIAIKGDAKATANKVRSRLHHMFEFARGRGYVTSNPVSDTKPYEGGNNQSERFYSADEIKNILQVIEQINEPARSYLKIIMLTGQRRTETLMMKWENITHEKDDEFEGWIWTIPKQYAKSNRDHVVPLSPMARDVLSRLKERAGENPFVFASGAGDDIPIGLKTVKRAVKKIKDESGVSDYRLHDTRRTVATWLAKLGTPAEVVSKVLNHKTGGGGSLVTRIYNRYEYRPERQKALNRWSQQIEKILADDNKGNVIEMRA